MLQTRLTKKLKIDHPIILAPMAFAAGGGLAAAVSKAGGLGLIGGGYGDREWLRQQFEIAKGHRVGCGFITWSLAKQPELLDFVLAQRPLAICLSFGDPRTFAAQIRAAGVALFCQVQTRRDAEIALDAGVDVVIAQGAEAGGHGQARGTLTLVPEVADLIAARSTDTLLCAAGGIADGRGLAAALMLGADGVLVGSRLWASREANVGERMHQAALHASGDDTIRSSVMDIARRLEWPEQFTARVLRNKFIERWHGREDELLLCADREAQNYRQAWLEGDPDNSNTFVGEVVGMIHDIEPAARIIERMVREAASTIRAAGDRVTASS